MMLYDPTQGSPERKLLMLAAEQIERHGWCRGYLRDDNHRVCLIGAIKSVLDEGILVEYHAAMLLLQRAIYHRMGKVINISNWNDDYCRDAADAAAILRTAAIDAKSSG